MIVPEEAADVVMQATSTLLHLCPHKDEEDVGSVTITWQCAGGTLELHALAEYLGKYEQCEISHEAITDRIYHDLAALSGIEDVQVLTRWTTAGMEVQCATSPQLLETRSAK